MVGFIRDSEFLEADELDPEKINAINDQTRLKILEILKKEPAYPAKIADLLGLDKQKVYYHIEILKEAGLIEKDREEKKSGGLATFYRPSSGALALDLGGTGEEISFGDDETVRNFLQPLVQSAKLNGHIVVGSPDQHGSDQVRARDGHLAGEIGLKLGEYGSTAEKLVKLDTEIVREELFDQNLLILGGVLTNTVAKRFNGSFPVKFEGDEFPYRKIKTPKAEYSEPDIGFISKTDNPENPEKSIYIIAGVRNKGTSAAIEAFKQLEDILEDYESGDFYCVVRGLDLDGDGEIDDYNVIETA